ncbi:MAG: hypothetical protein Satyrvirus34_2 [Satyrvirus sp.]|uniref:Uncharacterized protein n=1 Tax=Satyrvirus sp. TaxID=2487771 RepID=A0A3G5AEW1_9VIRU|nr:MAG: hypothetical protein Satyrvirus34_2 [Satyrvirus sp.]
MVNNDGGGGWILMKVNIQRRPLRILIMVNNNGGQIDIDEGKYSKKAVANTYNG